MLTMEEPSKPAETGLLREDGGSGAHAEDTATLSGEHGLAEQTLNQQLQQQVAQLHEALRRQESQWAAAQRHLQSQIDALVQQNLELRDGLTAPRPLWEADAALGARRKLDTLAAHQSSQSLQEQSGQKSLEPAAGVARLQDGPAAQGKGTRPLPCKGPEGGLLTRERAGRSACSPPGTAKPQNPPGEPGPSHVDAQTEQGDQEEGMRSLSSEGDTMGFEDLTSWSHQGVYEKEATLLTHSLDENVAEALGKGHEAVTFSKGTGKNRGAGQKTTVLRFLNGDMKKVLPDQRVVYGFADARTTRTTHPSALAIVRFPEQTEKYHPDGSKEIVHPDGTVRRLSGGREETVFPDGTVVTVERNGDRTIVFSNGQREIQTAGFTQREYPDGTVRTVYYTGSQETRSASGTVRIRALRNKNTPS